MRNHRLEAPLESGVFFCVKLNSLNKKQMENVYAIIVGVVVGAVFGLLKLPIPSPNVLPGILGIFGLYLGGFHVAPWIIKTLMK